MIHILVVEDEKNIREVLADQLKLSGYQVTTAENGKIGLDLALKEKPDLILLDILMPVMTGDQLIEQLHKDIWGKTVPIILLTNTSDLSKINEALKMGIKDYIIKADINLSSIPSLIQERLARPKN